MNWRWMLFWLRDFCKGGKIKKAYKDIENSYYKKINVRERTEEKLSKLLDYAKKNTTFYSQYSNCTFEKMPVISKVDITKNYEGFYSEEFKGKNLHKMSTSGSTGIPLTVIQNKEKRNRVLAEILFFNKICGYKFGEKQVFYRIWNEKNKKNILQKILQNIVTRDISHLDEETLKIISNELKNKKIKNILSYASTLDVLSKYMEDCNNVKFRVKSIISSSEILQDDTRKRLKDIFKCNVVSRYSNQENGIIAQECIDFNEMHLNEANYYVEFLKIDTDEPAEEGEISRVVITDLYNYAMPIIRYDTGDLAIYKRCSECKTNSKVITSIYGRKVDIIYNTQGKTLSPHIITNNMWGIKGIKQFKFIQIDKTSYKFILNTNQPTEEDDEIVGKFKNLLGTDAKIEIEYVDEIPVLASGKRKYIENRMNS